MKIHMVQFDWSTQDDSDIEIDLFDTYKKAYDRFNEIIANEKTPDLSWAADAFGENGNTRRHLERMSLLGGMDFSFILNNKRR